MIAFEIDIVIEIVRYFQQSHPYRPPVIRNRLLFSPPLPTPISPPSQPARITPAEKITILENRALLQKLANCFVKDSSAESERVCLALLKALIPIGRFMLRHSLRGAAQVSGATDSSRPVTPTFADLMTAPPTTTTGGGGGGAAGSSSLTTATPGSGSGGFPQLMVIMATLAGAGRSGQGHAILFKAALEWTNLCKSRLGRSDLASVIRGGDDDDDDVEGGGCAGPITDEVAEARTTVTASSKSCLESICFLLSYVGEILGALKLTSTKTEAEGEHHQHDWTTNASSGAESDFYYLLEGEYSNRSCGHSWFYFFEQGKLLLRVKSHKSKRNYKL